MRKTKPNILKQAALEYQKGYIIKALRANHGNVTVAAKRMGLHRNTLILKINAFNIRKNYKDILTKVKFKSNSRIKASKKNNLKEATHRFERKYIKYVLKETMGNETRAAKLLEIHRNTLLNKISTLKLKDYIEKYRWKKRRNDKALLHYHEIVKPKMQASYIDKKTKLIGKKLKEAREKAGLSQKKLAELSQISSVIICHVERGEEELTPQVLNKISRVLKIKQQ